MQRLEISTTSIETIFHDPELQFTKHVLIDMETENGNN